LDIPFVHQVRSIIAPAIPNRNVLLGLAIAGGSHYGLVCRFSYDSRIKRPNNSRWEKSFHGSPEKVGSQEKPQFRPRHWASWPGKESDFPLLPYELLTPLRNPGSFGKPFP
jgi:hypothetical protein